MNPLTTDEVRNLVALNVMTGQLDPEQVERFEAWVRGVRAEGPHVEASEHFHSFGFHGKCLTCGASPEPMSDEDLDLVRQALGKARREISDRIERGDR